MAEIIIRFEHDGGYTSYAIEVDSVINSSAEAYPSIAKFLPGWISNPLGAFLFGLRHGPLQKVLKENNLPPLDKNKSNPDDKNADAVRALMQVIMKSMLERIPSEDGKPLPIDISRDDLAGAYEGLIRRVPEYDGLPHETPAAYIAEPVESAAE